MGPYRKTHASSDVIDDAWEITDGNDSVIAILETETMADILLASLLGDVRAQPKTYPLGERLTVPVEPASKKQYLFSSAVSAFTPRKFCCSFVGDGLCAHFDTYHPLGTIDFVAWVRRAADNVGPLAVTVTPIGNTCVRVSFNAHDVPKDGEEINVVLIG